MRGTFLISEESVWNANFDHIWLVLFSFSMYLFPSFYMTLMNWFSNILLHNGGKKNKGFWWTIQSKQLYYYFRYVFIEEFYSIYIEGPIIYLFPRQNAEAFWRNWNEVTFDSNLGFSPHIGEGGYSISSI